MDKSGGAGLLEYGDRGDRRAGAPGGSSGGEWRGWDLGAGLAWGARGGTFLQSGPAEEAAEHRVTHVPGPRARELGADPISQETHIAAHRF